MKLFNNGLTLRNSGSLFDPFFDDFFSFPKVFDHDFDSVMKTDVIDQENSYLMCVDLPGFRKEDVSLSLKNGYLTISATSSIQDDENKKYVRRERIYSSCKRTFYLGNGVTEKDVSADFKDGVLNITIQKALEKVQEDTKIEIK